MGYFIYKEKTFTVIIMDLFLSSLSLNCVIYIFYYCITIEYHFFTTASLVGIIYLGALTLKITRAVLLIYKFRRNARRDPTYKDMVDLAPEAPKAPRFM